MAATRVDVEAVAAAFRDAVKNQDAAAAASLYHEDAKLMAPNMPVCEGRAAIQAAMQMLFDAGARSVEIETIEVRDEGAFTVEYGRFTLSIERPGSPLVTDTDKYIVVHETRPDGTTKILYDIFNSDLPAHA
jgi:ketosteroid isomerase-like protein